MRTVLALSTLVLVTACGKKAAPEPAAAAEAPAAPALTVAMPDDPKAKAFAERRTTTPIADWKPLGAGAAAEFVYNQLTFAPDGTWRADATVTASFETFPCKEQGTWSLESAESAETGTIATELTKTSCATREAGAQQRYEMTIGKGGEFTAALR